MMYGYCQQIFEICKKSNELKKIDLNISKNETKLLVITVTVLETVEELAYLASTVPINGGGTTDI